MEPDLDPQLPTDERSHASLPFHLIQVMRHLIYFTILILIDTETIGISWFAFICISMMPGCAPIRENLTLLVS